MIKSRTMRLARVMLRDVRENNTRSESVGTRERKRPLGSARLRLEDSIKIDTEYTGQENMDWNSSSSGHRQW
jgi:hypothetical protein